MVAVPFFAPGDDEVDEACDRLFCAIYVSLGDEIVNLVVHQIGFSLDDEIDLIEVQVVFPVEFVGDGECFV